MTDEILERKRKRMTLEQLKPTLEKSYDFESQT